MASTGDQKYKVLPQFLSSLAVSFGACNVGAWMSFSSVALPKMMMETQDYNQTTGLEKNLFTVDLHVGSWVVREAVKNIQKGCTIELVILLLKEVYRLISLLEFQGPWTEQHLYAV